MVSKYDRYWRNILPEIKNLVVKAFQTGYSSEIDVSDIRRYGNRQYWGTRITIPPETAKITEELSPDVHGKSLGNIIIHSGILENRKETLFAKILERRRKIYLHFETRKTAKPFALSSSWAPEGEDTVIGGPSEEAYARAINALRNVEPQSRFVFGKWKRLSESDSKKIAILRVCSPQTRIANLRSLEYSPDMDKLLKNEMHEEERFAILRKHGIRFPDQKTERISRLLSLNILGLIQSLEQLSGASLSQERRARERVMTVINGMGLKTASDFLKDIGFSKYLAVLDSRNLRFLQDMDLASKQLKAGELTKRKIYYKLEDIENELAKKMGITVSELDEKIMTYTGEEKPHRI